MRRGEKGGEDGSVGFVGMTFRRLKKRLQASAQALSSLLMSATQSSLKR